MNMKKPDAVPLPFRETENVRFFCIRTTLEKET